MLFQTTCPWCLRVNDLTSHVEAKDGEAELGPEVKPQSGDITLCMRCGKFSVFGGDGLRRPTRVELVDIGLDPTCRAMRQAWDSMR